MFVRPRTAGNHIEDEEESQEDSEEQMLVNPYREKEQEENPHQAGHMYRELLHSESVDSALLLCFIRYCL